MHEENFTVDEQIFGLITIQDIETNIGFFFGLSDVVLKTTFCSGG